LNTFDLDIALNLRPGGHRQRDIVIIVENGAAERHLSLVPFRGVAKIGVRGNL
jgi:hypothetical protein